MTRLENIKEAIVEIKDGTIHITFGHELNKKNGNFHNRLSFEVHNGGTELLVKGYKTTKEDVCGLITENDKLFKFYCDALIGFKDEVRTMRKFSWKKFAFEKFQGVWNSPYGEYYRYEEKFWRPIEYRANNWVLTEFKKLEIVE